MRQALPLRVDRHTLPNFVDFDLRPHPGKQLQHHVGLGRADEAFHDVGTPGLEQLGEAFIKIIGGLDGHVKVDDVANCVVHFPGEHEPLLVPHGLPDLFFPLLGRETSDVDAIAHLKLLFLVRLLDELADRFQDLALHVSNSRTVRVMGKPRVHARCKTLSFVFRRLVSGQNICYQSICALQKCRSGGRDQRSKSVEVGGRRAA
ncbi:hypothetical protein IWZ03DRAFT_378295 [Phyllosticta citriasiana]|uniref:Uncharacterized protein n=1 Tax=Phyllosticta citriasiana TaxID=595635 RepID=A0ABR1KKV6_9PEZI